MKRDNEENKIEDIEKKHNEHCENDEHCKCDEHCDCDEVCDCGEHCDCDEDCDCEHGEKCHCDDFEKKPMPEHPEHMEHEENPHHDHEHHECHCHEHLKDENHPHEPHEHPHDEKKPHHEHEPHDEHCEHGHHHLPPHVLEEKAREYLEMAQRLQADFDNYRKRVTEQLAFQRQEGIRSVIDVFLPCLDTFKEAKKNITDEKILSGIEMIEDKINSALKTLNVEKIESVGHKFDHNLHEVIAIRKDENFADDIILEEFQAGYKLNDKVIRYAKVIVNKL